MRLEKLNEVEEEEVEDEEVEDEKEKDFKIEDELWLLQTPDISKRDLLDDSLKGNDKAANFVEVYGEGKYDSYADYIRRKGNCDIDWDYDDPIEVHTRNEKHLGEELNGVEFKEELLFFGPDEKLTLAGVFPSFSEVAEGMVILDDCEEKSYDEQLKEARKEYELEYGSSDGLVFEHSTEFEEGVFLAVPKDLHRVGHTGTGVVYNKES